MDRLTSKTTLNVIFYYLMINGVFLGVRVKQPPKHKGLRQECRQFVRRAAICTDKTLITLIILKSNEHAYAAQPIRVLLRSFS